MSQARQVIHLNQSARVLGLAVVLCVVLASTGCGTISSSSNPANRDPLGLGVQPGPLGTTDPQIIEVRLGSESSDRIVSLSLTINTLQATNSGDENLDLLAAPITVEFNHNAIVTEPIFVGQIYQDTYSALIVPDMTGQVVFYDSLNHLTTQSLNVTGGTVTLSPALVLGASPEVFNVSLDLSQTFTVGASSVTVNPIVVTASYTEPVFPVAPAVSQPETGGVSFLVGTVSTVDTGAKTISMQPTAGEVLLLSYDNTTQFVNGDPTILTGTMIEVEAATQSGGAVLASRVTLIDNSSSSSELYGFLGGPAPDGASYNLIVAGGAGVNVTTDLIGKNITADWIAAGYSVNDAHLDLSASPDLVFDEARVFPGQFVAAQWDSLIVPDPDSDNAGYIQPRMFELQEQTVSGQVSDYVFNAVSNTATFTLDAGSGSPLVIMNPGLISVTVRQTPQTYMRNSPTFADGDSVKVRGLLFANPDYSNANYQAGDPVAFIMVADRISH